MDWLISRTIGVIVMPTAAVVSGDGKLVAFNSNAVSSASQSNTPELISRNVRATSSVWSLPKPNRQSTTSKFFALKPSRLFVTFTMSPICNCKARKPNVPEIVNCSRFLNSAIFAIRCAIVGVDVNGNGKSCVTVSPPSTLMKADDVTCGKSVG